MCQWNAANIGGTPGQVICTEQSIASFGFNSAPIAIPCNSDQNAWGWTLPPVWVTATAIKPSYYATTTHTVTPRYILIELESIA